MDARDIAEIADGLSEAHKRALRGVRQTYGGETLVNSSSNQNTRDALEQMGLIQHSVIFGTHMVLTIKGLAVRQHLEVKP